MRKNKGIILKAIYEASVVPATGRIERRVIPQVGDTAEDRERADAKMRRDLARDQMGTPLGAGRKLIGKRDAMSAPIEAAIAEAIDPNCVHSVWAALKAIAKREDRQAPLLGVTDDGTLIRYDGQNKIDLFAFKQLKLRLERQRKPRTDS
jgi:hypothetical protein